jgi:hypothetical protein
MGSLCANHIEYDRDVKFGSIITTEIKYETKQDS